MQSGISLVLQPMTRASALRRVLDESGFRTLKESIVKSGTRYYQILSVEFDGILRESSLFELEIGKENLEKTIEKLFSKPFGQGYPKSEAERKKKDTLLLKELRKNSQVSISEFLAALPKDLMDKIRTKENVIAYIRENGKDPDILAWLR